ncbi:MAG: hypothetical protein ACYTEL_21840 [Planctomycetota bacterium]
MQAFDKEECGTTVPELSRRLDKRSLEAQYVLLVTLAIYAGVAWEYVRTGKLNADEGIYCLSAKKAVEGDLPYRDFAYSQMPVLPYVNGLAMKMVGFGYLEQRTVNAFWGVLTLVAVFYLGHLVSNGSAAAVAAWTAAASLSWVHYVCMGKTYAATGLFVVLSATGTYARWSYYKKTLLFTVAAVAAVGCRLTTVPVLFILWVFLILQAESHKQRTIAVILPVLAGIGVFLPFFLADRENFWFWNLGYHLATALDRRGWLSVKEHLELAPAVLLLMVVALAGVVIKLRRLKLQKAGLFLAAVIAITLELCMKSSYGANSATYLPLCAVGAAALISEYKWFQRAWPVFLVTSLLAWLGPGPMTQDYMPAALLDTAKFVREHTSANDRVLTSFPIIAIEAEREVFAGLEMGKFAVTSELPEDKARRLHLVTPAMLTELVATEQPGAVILHGFPSPWNFTWSVPSLRPNDRQQIATFFDTMNRHYYLGFKNERFAVLLPNRSSAAKQ